MAKNRAASALGKLRAKAGDLAMIGAKGGLKRGKNLTTEQLSEQSKAALFARWRNHHSGEHDLHGTPIPEKYAVAIAEMTDEQRRTAMNSAKKRAGNITKRARASGKSE